MQDIKKTARIKAAIAYAGLNQRKVAEALGMTPANFSFKITRGTVSDDDIVVVVEVIGCRLIQEALEFPDGRRM